MRETYRLDWAMEQTSEAKRTSLIFCVEEDQGAFSALPE